MSGVTETPTGSLRSLLYSADLRPDIEGEIVRCLAFSFRRRLFEQVAFGVREDRSRFGSRSLAGEHRQPCHPPGDDAAKRNAVGQAIGRGEIIRSRSGVVLSSVIGTSCLSIEKTPIVSQARPLPKERWSDQC